MSKKNKGAANKSALEKFLTFWSTLPGILTGVAAVITAIAGLYIAFGTGGNHSPSPTPLTSPTREIKFDTCLEQEFSEADSIEENGQSDLHLRDGVIRIKLKVNGIPIGALKLRFYKNDNLNYVQFKVEEAVDSQCHKIKELSPAEDGKQVSVPNYQRLTIPLGDYNYFLGLELNRDRVIITATLNSSHR